MKGLFIVSSFILLTMMMNPTASAQKMDEKEVLIETVTGLFKNTDSRNWKEVEEVFADQVILDYTSMIGGTPSTLSPQQIVSSWKEVLPGFENTRHMVGHFQTSRKRKVAYVSHVGTANHYLNGESWTVIGNYEHRLQKTDKGWKITSMKFNLEFIDGNTDLPNMAQERVLNNWVDAKQIVNQFFEALETSQFDKLKDIFAADARQLNPYVPEGFPKSFDGIDAIYNQYSSLPQTFGKMRFPRELYATKNSDMVFVKFRGEIEIKSGGKYENDYFGIFKLEGGKIVEYTEYFNPIVMAKAFNIRLN